MAQPCSALQFLRSCQLVCLALHCASLLPYRYSCQLLYVAALRCFWLL
jgi:hypothetical protein